MSTFQGSTVSAYEAISPYRLYLDLSSDDRDFSSNVKNPLVYSEESTSLSTYNSIKNFHPSPDTSTYGIIRQFQNASIFKIFIDKFNLTSQMNGDFTLFVPINQMMDIINDKLKNTPLEALDIFNYHKLNYIIEPVQLINRIIRLQTKLRNQYITVSNMKIISEAGGIKDNNPNKILQSIKTDNGYIYIIERPLIPYIY
jgi:hypothetical protein